jgi:hypothetical protein
MKCRPRTALLTLAAIALSAAPVSARTLITSTSPYWMVGSRDDALSRACSIGRFGVARPGRLIARFVGRDGPGILEIAKGTGLNLYDPDHRAKRSEDYYFHNHGTTACEVFVGGRGNR